jgi:VanZ family protein
MTRRQLIISRILLVLYLAAVCVLCFGHFTSVPKVQPSFLGIPTDKIVHFLMFFPFPILVFLAFNRYGEKRPWKWLGVLLTFLVGEGIAIGTELVQGLTVYRSKDPKDFLADSIALAAASLIVLFFSLKRRSRS